MCYWLTNSHERFDRFQVRLTRQLDLAWLQQKLGLFVADIPDHAWLGDLPSKRHSNCLVGALLCTHTLLSSARHKSETAAPFPHLCCL